MKFRVNTIGRAYIIVLSFLLFTSGACTVRLLAPYDEITDTKSAELQEKILYRINSLESIYRLNNDSSVLTYKSNLDFYNQVKTTVQVLISRNEGVDKNKIITGQLKGLEQNIDLMEKTHMEDTILSADVDLLSFRTIFNTQLGSIQRFQQTRKSSKDK